MFEWWGHPHAGNLDAPVALLQTSNPSTHHSVMLPAWYRLKLPVSTMDSCHGKSRS